MDSKQEKEQPKEPRQVVSIFAKPDGSYELKSILPPPNLIYLLEKMKVELVLKDREPSKIVQPQGDILNFIRRKK